MSNEDKTNAKLAKINQGMEWRQRRMRRDANAIAKLEAQRKRLLKPKAATHKNKSPSIIAKSLPPVSGDLEPTPEVSAAAINAETKARLQSHPTVTMVEDDGLIPTFLQRSPAEKLQSAEDAVRQAILDEQAELKARKTKGRIAKLKASKSGATRAMPLSGKAALAKINAKD